MYLKSSMFCVVFVVSQSLCCQSALQKTTFPTHVVLSILPGWEDNQRSGLTYRPRRSAARSPSSPRRSQTSAAATRDGERENSSMGRKKTQRICSCFKSLAAITHFDVVQELLFPAPYAGQLIPLLQRKVLGYWRKGKAQQELRGFEMDVFEGGAGLK